MEKLSDSQVKQQGEPTVGCNTLLCREWTNHSRFTAAYVESLRQACVFGNVSESDRFIWNIDDSSRNTLSLTQKLHIPQISKTKIRDIFWIQPQHTDAHSQHVPSWMREKTQLEEHQTNQQPLCHSLNPDQSNPGGRETALLVSRWPGSRLGVGGACGVSMEVTGHRHFRGIINPSDGGRGVTKKGKIHQRNVRGTKDF